VLPCCVVCSFADTSPLDPSPEDSHLASFLLGPTHLLSVRRLMLPPPARPPPHSSHPCPHLCGAFSPVLVFPSSHHLAPRRLFDRPTHIDDDDDRLPWRTHTIQAVAAFTLQLTAEHTSARCAHEPTNPDTPLFSAPTSAIPPRRVSGGWGPPPASCSADICCSPVTHPSSFSLLTHTFDSHGSVPLPGQALSCRAAARPCSQLAPASCCTTMTTAAPRRRPGAPPPEVLGNLCAVMPPCLPVYVAPAGPPAGKTMPSSTTPPSPTSTLFAMAPARPALSLSWFACAPTQSALLLCTVHMRCDHEAV
jgi:hypothetical protein